MSIRPCKPCFVEDNYLSKQSLLGLVRFPSQSLLPNLDFSLVGFTAFHLYVSIKLRHCGTFRSSTIVSLRSYSAVTHSCVPSVIFSASAITTSITARASMDFPLAEASNHPDRMLFNVMRIESVLPQKCF